MHGKSVSRVAAFASLRLSASQNALSSPSNSFSVVSTDMSFLLVHMSSCATCANVDLAPPRLVVSRPLGCPMERVALDLEERPPRRTAARIGAFLDDISGAGAACLGREEIGCRVVPEDAPSVEIRV